MSRPPASAPLLSSEKITRHALKLVDEQGMEALSIRKLAADLSVSPKSLYHYFPTKEDLLQGMYARILEELEVPDMTLGTWQDRFLRLAHSVRRSMLRHASFSGHYFQGHQVSAEELDIYESLYGLLRQIGLPDAVITSYGSVLVIFLVGFCYAELNGNFDPKAFTHRKGLATQQPDRFPLALSLPMPQEEADRETFFELALNLIMGGLEKEAAQAQL